MKENDIRLTARVLIEIYGENAEMEATRRYTHASREGSLSNFRVWKRVKAAVVALRYGAAGTDTQAH